MSVIPTTVKAIGQEFYDILAAGIGADTVSFSESTLHLTEDDFTPSQGMAPPTPFAGGGLGGIIMNGASLNVSIDPLTGDNVFRFTPPVGGWYWETSSTSGLPATIRGWFMMNPDNDAVLAAALLDTPVLLEASSQSVEVDQVEVRLPAGGLQ